ncbi:hypothetical protein BR93DRAFT_956297 [Coniochaeta sp. PMI_546]|nr:hypothetical protein BR93DRAFT_956297 [Coniochaeta sp. PMI_546]
MEANGLDKFLPKSIAAKRRRKKQGSIAETTSSNDEGHEAASASGSGGADGAAGGGDGSGPGSSASSTPRGRSIISREQTAGTGTGTGTGTGPSTSSNSLHKSNSNSNMTTDQGEEISLVSYDSDSELPDRPAITSTHPSQIGYLTTNSPIVQAAVHLETQPSQTSDIPSPRFSSTFPVNSTSTDSLASGAALTTSKTGLAAPTSKIQRSPSPVGRFRDVFKKKTSSGTGSPSPERQSLVESVRPKSSSLNSSKTDLESLKETEPTKAPASSERVRRLSQGAKVDTSRPPRTPPSNDNNTPTIVNTPPTPTDPHYPSFQASPVRTSTVTTSPQTNASPQKGNMISQRRRAGSGTLGPSKLSNIVPAPLTPTPENPASPGNSVSGFFSSMISTVQSTANTLSNSISTANLGQGTSRNRLPLQEDGQSESQAGEDSVEVESGTGATSEHSMNAKEPAVKTLGKGDLSLSQLGIEEPKSAAATPLTAKFPDLQNESARGRSESAPIDSNSSDAVDRSQDLNRPQSLYEPVGASALGERTPPQGSVYEGKAGIARSGSIRSAIAGRRKRGSSVATGATGGTIAAAIAAANASITRPQTESNAPKLTGFAVASKKRNRDFHALFKSVPDDDYLIEDYSCALQREILAHGRLYVSEGHLCFSSNIFGWVTTLVMSFDEIVAVEKRSTALVFKNGLEISTLHAKHVFASFTGRDATYDLIVKIWKLGHPSLKSSLNGVRIDETGGDRTEKIDVDTSSIGGSATISGSGSDSDEDGDDIYDEDEDNDDTVETTQATEQTSLDANGEKAVARKPSGAPLSMPAAKSEERAAGTPAQDFPGPATHAPTDCGDAATHYDIVIGDDVIPAPLGKVYNLMFGPASSAWMAKWITGDQKCTELTGLLEDKKGLTEENKSRGYTYIKPLYASIGPKQTKCIVTEQLDNLDLEKAVNISCSTQNPDVPSGNVFTVKTKYCLSWAENNGTRVQANCTIEWTGKSWLKESSGPIEKGAKDGQTQYCKDLFASLKAAVVSRPRSSTLGGAQPKTRKKGRKGRSAPSNPTSDGEGVGKAVPKQDWGLFEPARPFLGPFVDILGPVMTGNVVYGLLVGLLVATWFGFGSNASGGRYGRELGYIASADRQAAYEEMWRREESELWDWLEERVGLERLNGAPIAAVLPRKKGADPRSMEEKMREDRMSEREIREAIRVTEEKLRVLKEVVEREAEVKAAQD